MEIKHHYIERGAGSPLILLHGNGEDASYFEHQMEPFSRHFRVIAIDTRGHGRLILDGANLDASGVRRSVQIPIEIGYRMARLFAKKKAGARKNAEMLGLMVNDPNVKAEELRLIQAPTLVLAGTRDMIKTSHTRLIAQSVSGAQLSLIPGDHFIANKNPDAFNEAVLRFLL